MIVAPGRAAEIVDATRAVVHLPVAGLTCAAGPHREEALAVVLGQVVAAADRDEPGLGSGLCTPARSEPVGVAGAEADARSTIRPDDRGEAGQRPALAEGAVVTMGAVAEGDFRGHSLATGGEVERDGVRVRARGADFGGGRFLRGGLHVGCFGFDVRWGSVGWSGDREERRDKEDGFVKRHGGRKTTSRANTHKCRAPWAFCGRPAFVRHGPRRAAG